MVSRWGDTFNTVVLVVLVFRLTGSGLGVTSAVIDWLPRVGDDRCRPVAHGPGRLLPLVDQHPAAVYVVAFGLAAGGVFFNSGGVVEADGDGPAAARAPEVLVAAALGETTVNLVPASDAKGEFPGWRGPVADVAAVPPVARQPTFGKVQLLEGHGRWSW